MVLNPALPRPPLATGTGCGSSARPSRWSSPSRRAAAVDAAELVEVDYDPLPAVVDPEAALAPDAAPQYAGQDTNLAGGVRSDGGASGGDVLDDAEVVVRARMVNQRLAVLPMEANAILVEPGDGGGLTIRVSTQMPHGFRAQARGVVRAGARAGAGDHPARRRRVRREGRRARRAHGDRSPPPARWAARSAGSRPARRTSSRCRTAAARSPTTSSGLTRDGRITGLRVRVVADSGAYAGFGGALALGPTYR
jgi:carbon-monoxide dehydrogenase large subunit